jgi:tetratricopeptide (TPR) repeat protein
MKGTGNLGLAGLLLLPLAACAPEQEGEQIQMAAASANVVMVMPVSTSSAEALDYFMQGQRALDMGRLLDARPYFERAAAADPNFCLAYLRLANAATSLESFQMNLERAAANAEGASEAERLLVEFNQKGFDNDVEGQFQVAERLVQLQPESPRAWMTLANAQSAMGNESEARTTWLKAAELSPGFATAHMALGNSYLFVEPRDLAKAQEHMEKAVELEPNEAFPHDLLGDAYRARGELELAVEEYTRTAELDPTSGSGLQQRGHVYSFLGNYEQARADYDAAIEMAQEGNVKVSFGVFRTLVHVHEENPAGAVDELNELVGKVDAMGIAEPTGAKIFALNNAIQIALHQEMFDAAERAMEQRDALVMQQATQIGSESADRNARATAVLGEGNLAARKGDHATATAKANEYMAIVAPNTSPLKNEPAYALLGFVSLALGNYNEAIEQYEQATPNDPYVIYYHALALEGAGKSEEAKALFQKVANYNFNSAGLALVRKDAMARAM